MVSATGVFPVPFNGADSLMRALDEPGRPQTIELEVALADILDDDRLVDAVTTAAVVHPTARAHQLAARPLDSHFPGPATTRSAAIPSKSVG